MEKKKTVSKSKLKKESHQRDDCGERAKKVFAILKKTYPDVHCSLDYKTPFQLVIATILSAQCTDDRVNKVTPSLFAKFPDAKTMAKASEEEIGELIRSTGFFRSKAKSISLCSQVIVEKYKGEPPRTLEELTQLRGIGRKTANVVLGNAYDIPGLPVDTHVGRLSRRLGLTKNLDPVKVEFDLMDLLPAKNWTMFSHLLIYHGRARCMARKPNCVNCEVATICPKLI